MNGNLLQTNILKIVGIIMDATRMKMEAILAIFLAYVFTLSSLESFMTAKKVKS